MPPSIAVWAICCNVHDHKNGEAMQNLGGDFFQQSNETIKSI